MHLPVSVFPISEASNDAEYTRIMAWGGGMSLANCLQDADRQLHICHSTHCAHVLINHWSAPHLRRGTHTHMVCVAYPAAPLARHLH